VKLDTEVAVVGAGLAGTSTATALARAGFRVALLDGASGGASAIPAAVMAPYPTRPTDGLTRLRSRGARYTAALLQRLEREGHDSGCRASGVLLIPASPRDRRRHSRARAQASPIVEPLVATEAATRLGTSPTEAALLHHRGCCVVLGRLIRALRARAGQRLVSAGVRVGHLDSDTDGVGIYDAAGCRWGRVAHVVLAMGPAVSSLWPTLADSLTPVRGQASAWPPNERSAGLAVALSGGGYVTPVIDGLHWAGGTVQPGVSSHHASADDDRANLERLRWLDPDYPDRQPTQRFVGVRAVTRDRVPLVHQIAARVWVNSGHGAHGLMTAPWSGALLAERIGYEWRTRH
jgi:tRNA U-34 5-methylaminomethyl-2-thiouridine biosynthesis protein MnmC